MAQVPAFADLPELMKVSEVIAFTRQGRNAVYSEIASGRLQSIRLSERNIRVSKRALQAWIDAATTGSAPDEPLKVAAA